jgi:diaminohydroxyphosphoribosylaminopyrimidine deaminase/5-amino-6-(5-phosphoribosylamino)uracil reductase
VSDDPSLTVRLAGYRGRQPLRVVVDGSGRVPASGALFDDAASTMVATTELAPREACEAWSAAGAEVLVVPADAGGRVELKHVLEHLSEACRRTDVLIEGGPTVAWSAVNAGLVDRFVIYTAPKLIGGTGAPGVLAGDGIASIAEAIRLHIISVERLGADMKVVADVHRDH